MKASGCENNGSSAIIAESSGYPSELLRQCSLKAISASWLMKNETWRVMASRKKMTGRGDD